MRKATIVARDATDKATRWAIDIELGRYEGKRHRKRVYGKTEREVKQKAAKLLETVQHGVDPAKAKVRIAEFMPRFLEHMKSRVRPSTYESYQRISEGFIVPELGHRQIGQLSEEHVDSFIDAACEYLNPRTGEPYAESYIVKMHAVLRRALQLARRWHYVMRNVAIGAEIPEGTKRAINPPTLEQVRLMLKLVEGHHYCGIYHVLVKLGMRRGEALAIRVADVHLDQATALLYVTGTVQRQERENYVDGPLTELVRREDTKSKAGDNRPIVFPATLTPVLLHQLQQRELLRIAAEKLGKTWTESGLLFTTDHGTAIEGHNVWRHFKKTVIPAMKQHYLKQGMSEEQVAAMNLDNFRLHDFRHYNISAMIQAGIDPKTAQTRAGHANVQTTLDIYAHASIESQRTAAAAIDACFYDDPTISQGDEGDGL